MKKKILFILFVSLFLFSNIIFAQKKDRNLSELINKNESAWSYIKPWIDTARNKVEILPKDILRADSALYQTQVTTKSTMGSIIYETGGILIDNGWIRVLGSGSKKLDRSLMDWNKGKSYSKLGSSLSYLLVADDILGGFFAINNGEFGKENIGKIFYFAPDNLKWQSLGMTYSEFIQFCFSGDINKFYDGFRWKNWEKEIENIDGNAAYTFYPYLCTKEGNDINKVSKKIVPINEVWTTEMDLQKLFLGK